MDSDKKGVTKTIGDNFLDNGGSLNDRLSESKNDDTLASKIKGDRITDLKSAIDINLKFLFIRELFNNDAVEYHNTIAKLNDISSVEEMLRVVTEKSEEFAWDEKNEAFVIFSEMVNRKIR
ncbi:MAG: hypothetical protein U9R32_05100 [Bacteroidota bacterium]|nr:hypothetical protein [Bacteroidota bacterium]